MRGRPIEPFLWILFSAGGVVAALCLPVLVLLLGVAFPLGWMAPPPHDHLAALLSHPVSRLGGAVLCTLSLVHAAHRFRYTLYDGLQIKHLNEVINLGCYGGAVAGSLWAAWVFFGI